MFSSLFSKFAILSLAATASCQKTFTNPIHMAASDPHITMYNGMYYLTSTNVGFISVTRSPTIAGLMNGETRTVWSDPDPSRCTNIWAPEMHRVNGIWRIFYSAGNGDIGAGQRSFVITGCDQNPFDCPYTFTAELTPPPGAQGGGDGNWAWSVDGTYLDLGYIGKQGTYHVASAVAPNGLQSIAIAALDTTTWTVGAWHWISSPTLPWEQADAQPGQPAAVNEGPNALYHGGHVWLSFSASWCGTPNYSLGLLGYDGVGDPLNATSWAKQGPVFSSTTGDFVGTGHNAFFHSPDGTELWNVFHATSIATGSCGGDRFLNAQKVTFDPAGNPVLGTPIKNGVFAVPSGEL